MARTNKKEYCRTTKKCKLFCKRRVLKFCDNVMHWSVMLCIIGMIWSISTDASSIVASGSGGYSSRRIHLDLSDGGYKGIVIKIDRDVPEKHCPRILSNIKVSMDALNTTNGLDLFIFPSC